MDSAKIKAFGQAVKKELYEDIVPFWTGRVIDKEKGGFIGRMTNDGTVIKNAPKGLILNTRILWTFSALHHFDKRPEHSAVADRAYDYLIKYFWDEENVGTHWMLDANGKPTDDKKRIYGQCFTIYALSEYHRAYGKEQALEKAKALFGAMEKHAYDKGNGGYFETFNRDWTLAKEQSLTAGDVVAKKSMNSHLHIVEGFANLYEVWKDELLAKRLEELLEIFLNRIIHQDRFYCQLFFGNDWRPQGDTISFGHDIEASWLLYRAAEILNKPSLLKELNTAGVRLAEVVYEFGMDNEKKSMFYEANSRGVSNTDKDWWVQAEAVIGFLNAYQLSGKAVYLDVALDTWEFIEKNLLDKTNGEWFWRVSAEGKVDNQQFKVSEWKAPYHNSRACMEIINRVEAILSKSVSPS